MGLFKKPKMPPPPRPTRMPNETDADVEEATRRTKSDFLARRGRLETIMTAGLGDSFSGKKLGG